MPLGSLRAGGFAPGTPARPALGRVDRPTVNTSWLPKTAPGPSVSAAASGLAPAHTPTSIWPAQGADPHTASQLPFAQTGAAVALPGAVLAAVYAVYQVVWRRGIFWSIATDPIGVNDFAARRSDDLNIVLLVATVVLVAFSALGAAWWVRHCTLTWTFRGAAGLFGGGLLASVVAAAASQGNSATRIAIAYVIGGLGCAAIAGALGYVFTRAVQAVVGDTSWLPRTRPMLPRVNPAGPGISTDALARLRSPQPSVVDLTAAGLAPAKTKPAEHDWSALKGK